MGLNNRIERLEKQLERARTREEKKKEKKFKIPFGKKVGKAQAKKNYVTVIKINENNNLEFLKKQIEEQTFMVDGVPRLGTPDYVLRFKNNPVVIQPSWSNRPYSPKEAHEKSLEDGSNIKGYKILLARMQEEALGKKKSMGNMIKIILGLCLAGIIGYAFLTGGA